jgi:PTS system galactitol-specific IIB component
MAKKWVLGACGTGIATSTVVASKIKDLLKERGIEADVVQCKAAEAPRLAEGYDLIVATTQVGYDGPVPVVRTVSFLTGINMGPDVDKIVAYLTA